MISIYYKISETFSYNRTFCENSAKDVDIKLAIKVLSHTQAKLSGKRMYSLYSPRIQWLELMDEP